MQARIAIVFTALAAALLAGCAHGRAVSVRCCVRAKPCCPQRGRSRPPCAKPEVAAPTLDRTTIVATHLDSAWDFYRLKYDLDESGDVTEEEYGRGKDAFGRLDVNDDGKLTTEDFQQATRMDRMIATVTLLRYFQSDADLSLTLEELDAHFGRIDRDDDGQLTEAELETVRREKKDLITPGIPRMPDGVRSFKSLAMLADADRSNGISADELAAFFSSADPDGDGVWKQEGPRMSGPPRVTGPAPGTDAPDFTLRPPDGGDPVTLSSFKDEKPVALIFGSYT